MQIAHQMLFVLLLCRSYKCFIRRFIQKTLQQLQGRQISPRNTRLTILQLMITATIRIPHIQKKTTKAFPKGPWQQMIVMATLCMRVGNTGSRQMQNVSKLQLCKSIMAKSQWFWHSNYGTKSIHNHELYKLQHDNQLDQIPVFRLWVHKISKLRRESMHDV